jgi:hypothetical protein
MFILSDGWPKSSYFILDDLLADPSLTGALISFNPFVPIKAKILPKSIPPERDNTKIVVVAVVDTISILPPKEAIFIYNYRL